MARALEKCFGVTPDLDVEAQRGILLLRKPMAIDWKKVEEKINGAGFTFAGAHLRVRGRAIQDDANADRLLFEVMGSGQRMVLRNPDAARPHLDHSIEAVLRLDGWKTVPPEATLIPD